MLLAPLRNHNFSNRSNHRSNGEIATCLQPRAWGVATTCHRRRHHSQWRTQLLHTPLLLQHATPATTYGAPATTMYAPSTYAAPAYPVERMQSPGSAYQSTLPSGGSAYQNMGGSAYMGGAPAQYYYP